VVELEGVVISISLLNEQHAENLFNCYSFLKIMVFWDVMYSSKHYLSPELWYPPPRLYRVTLKKIIILISHLNKFLFYCCLLSIVYLSAYIPVHLCVS
jgi:hypothetical protein